MTDESDVRKGGRSPPSLNSDTETPPFSKNTDESEQHKAEINELYESVQGVKVKNIMHVASVLKAGEQHISRARV